MSYCSLRGARSRLGHASADRPASTSPAATAKFDVASVRGFPRGRTSSSASFSGWGRDDIVVAGNQLVVSVDVEDFEYFPPGVLDERPQADALVADLDGDGTPELVSAARQNRDR